ncbi:MAG: Gfo/Idh/MocA family oxidoreductase [Candidatus Sumerlaeota bacterium]
MKPVRLAIIGCGIAARDLHWPALKNLRRQFSVVALCSRTRKSADALGDLIGCADRTTDYDALLRRDDIEALDLVLPIPLNHDFTLKALAAKKHVMVEKPIAASVKEAESLCRAAKKTPGVVAMVAENFRYLPALLQMKKMIDHGDVGTVYNARFDVFVSVTPGTNKYLKTAWRVNHEYPAGFPVDGGIHNVSALRFLFGELKTDRSVAQQIDPRLGDIDTMHIDYRATASSLPIQLNLYYSARGLREIRLMVFGPKGTLEMRGNMITLSRDGKEPRVSNAHDSGGYVEEFRAFHDAIRTGKPTLTPFTEGTRDLKTILEAVEKAEMRRLK